MVPRDENPGGTALLGKTVEETCDLTPRSGHVASGSLSTSRLTVIPSQSSSCLFLSQCHFVFSHRLPRLGLTRYNLTCHFTLEEVKSFSFPEGCNSSRGRVDGDRGPRLLFGLSVTPHGVYGEGSSDPNNNYDKGDANKPLRRTFRRKDDDGQRSLTWN